MMKAPKIWFVITIFCFIQWNPRNQTFISLYWEMHCIQGPLYRDCTVISNSYFTFSFTILIFLVILSSLKIQCIFRDDFLQTSKKDRTTVKTVSLKQLCPI